MLVSIMRKNTQWHLSRSRPQPSATRKPTSAMSLLTYTGALGMSSLSSGNISERYFTKLLFEWGEGEGEKEGNGRGMGSGTVAERFVRSVCGNGAPQ